MTDQNPYATPEPTAEESSERSTLEPQSFCDAISQGVKFGLKWGGVVWLGWTVLALVDTLAMAMASRRNVSCADFVVFILLTACICFVIAIVIGALMASLVYFLRKGIAALHR
ncbi:MAG TPA: hypothetical protein DD670_11595 [Planctomycetaceae bacterium]|nr:hypothetical protein [Planctomycetaceae bacterium]